MINKEELNKTINELISLGEDPEELKYWQEIFDDLPENQQKEVFALFEQELGQLTAK